ncbi:MAG: S41 family peptidase [Zavarzinella sp.]
MTRCRILGAFLVLLTMFSGYGLQADEKTTYALIVGAGKFTDPQIKARATADADASAIYDVLVDPARGRVSADKATLLLADTKLNNAAKTATKANILAAFEAITAKAKKEDTVLIYMVMQGAGFSGKPCVFAADSNFKERAKNALFPADIEAKIKDLKSEKVCFFIDFNLKGFDSKEAVVAPRIFDFVRVAMAIPEDDESGKPASGRGIYLAQSGLQPVLVIEKHGLFTAATLDALKGEADTDGFEADGQVTTDELTTFYNKKLLDYIRKVANTAEERNQRVSYSGKPLHLTLTRNPEPAKVAEERLAKFAKMKGEFSKEVAIDGQSVLDRMPRLLALQDLRKVYQQFIDGKITKEELLAGRTRIIEGMKISDEDAQLFARKVSEGLRFVKANYIKPLEMPAMVKDGIEGMFERMEVPISEQLRARLDKSADLEYDDLVDLLADARKALGKREDLADNLDVEIAFNLGMRKYVDDYTVYFNQEKSQDMDREMGRFTGIGVQIRRDIARDGLLVVTPIRGSPAYRAGIKTGDLVTEVIWEEDPKGKKLDEPKVHSTKGLDVTDAVKLILGEPGTRVKLKIDREGSKEPVIIEIVRGLVESESVYGYKRNKDDSWNYFIDEEKKIGYVHLTQFSATSGVEMRKALTAMQEQGVKGVVLDLRFNPGGYLSTAVDICDMFIDDGVIVSVRPRNSLVGQRVIRGQSRGSFLDFPMVCLINGGSASGSEILSACLQDHNRAIIVGERSFGKGSVQNVERFALTDGRIKITTATFWPPSARNLNKASTPGKPEDVWGVMPDKGYELKLERAESDKLYERLNDWGIIPRRDLPAKEPTEKFEDKQLDLGLKYLRDQINLTRK